MRSLLIIFAILLVILTLISSLGGSLNAKEHFFDATQEEPHVEGFYGDEEVPIATQEIASPQKQPPTENFVDAPESDHVESQHIEPFEAEGSMHASF